MKSRSKAPKKFSWKITAEPKQVPDTIVFQEQCSSGNCGGTGGKCGSGKCGGSK